MHFNSFLKSKTGTFLSSVLTGLIVTRVLALLFFAIATHFPSTNQQFIDDAFHHYYFGLGILIVSFLIKKNAKAFLLTGFGLGVILEESAVILDTMGFEGFRFFYLNGFDFILIIAGIVLWGIVAFYNYKIEK